MDLPLNGASPTIMHLDMDSCFATIEQQANPLLRGKPIAVAAYTTASGCILSPSIEAKRLRIKTGMRIGEARLLYPNLYVCSPDPEKYRAVYEALDNLLSQYSPFVVPKSIDEFVIDFAHTQAIQQGLVPVAKEIKRRIRQEIGDWISCTIGIGPNRFLAKTAASLHKPDGLDIITHKNLREVYTSLSLVDLHGINVRFQARLNRVGIFTPLAFLEAPLFTLSKKVFQSILGFYWYLRLRGWEIDAIDFKRKSYGHSYALPKPTASKKELLRLLMKLTEKMGRRLRRGGQAASGVHVACVYTDSTHWHMGKTFSISLYSTQDLYRKAKLLLNFQPISKAVANLAVSCYGLTSTQSEQLDLFGNSLSKTKLITKAMDRINDRYGEFTVCTATMIQMKDVIIDRISFGKTNYSTSSNSRFVN